MALYLAEAQGGRRAARGQTQGRLDLEVGAAPHLRHSVSVGGTQCDLDPGSAGTPQHRFTYEKSQCSVSHFKLN